MKIKVDTYVKVKSFLGTKEPNQDLIREENYWKLIDEKGRIILEEDNKVLVLFNKDLDKLDLTNNNPQKNSLWLNKSDLELDQTTIYDKKLEKKISEKSALMNNTKWKYFLEVIDSLDVGIIAEIKFLLDDSTKTGSISGYSESIIKRKYIEMLGVIEFKEIEWIKIPSRIAIERKNRNEDLTPILKEQPIEKIAQKLENSKRICFELDEEILTVFGYK